MIRSKFCLLLVVLCAIIVCSYSDEHIEGGDSGPLKTKPSGRQSKKTPIKVESEEKEDDDLIDEDSENPQLLAGSQYASFDAPETTSKPRQQWSMMPDTVSDQRMNSNIWPQDLEEEALSLSPTKSSWENFALWNNRPTCYSLLDPSYPIFADVCGAVPQAKYSLPNSLGHQDRWQIAQFLAGVLTTSSDFTCARSLRLLLCPLLFSPCQSSYSAPPVLPCQSLCRAVKSRCRNPVLEYFPCESLPHTSELCPTKQRYGSMIPPNPYLSHNQGTQFTNGVMPQGFSYQPLRPLDQSGPFSSSATIFSSPITTHTMQQPIMHNFLPNMNTNQKVDKHQPPATSLTSAIRSNVPIQVSPMKV